MEELYNKLVAEIWSLIEDTLGTSFPDKRLESRIIDDLGADSLDVVEMILNFEDRFGMQIPDEKAETMATVKDIYDYIIEQVDKYKPLNGYELVHKL